jgi:uncharacterized protein GlcG (DUF336 family)
MIHVARSTCRRAERYVVTLSKEDQVSPVLLKYLNRLSDLLFALAREAIFKELISNVAKSITEGVNIMACNEKFSNLFEEMAAAAREEAKKLGVKVSIAIADKNGSLLYFNRFDDAILVSINIAINKAYTSVYMNMSTEELSKLTQSGDTLFGINTADPRLVIFGGGIPLVKDGITCGAVGISGASVEDDITIAQKAVEVFEKGCCK